MNKVTVDQIMSWEQCEKYPKERVKQIIGEGKTPLEFLDLKLDSPNDNLWLVLRPEVLGNALVPALLDIMERAVSVHKIHYLCASEVQYCIEVSRRFHQGSATKEELAAARAAARAAVRLAVRFVRATRATVYATVWDPCSDDGIDAITKLFILAIGVVDITTSTSARVAAFEAAEAIAVWGTRTAEWPYPATAFRAERKNQIEIIRKHLKKEEEVTND